MIIILTIPHQGVIFLGSEAANKPHRELVEKYSEERVLVHDCDITDKNSLKAGFEAAKAKFDRLDIVCNLGSSWDEIEWEKTIQISLVMFWRSVWGWGFQTCSSKQGLNVTLGKGTH